MVGQGLNLDMSYGVFQNCMERGGKRAKTGFGVICILHLEFLAFL